MNLTDFLLARIAEDEATAREASGPDSLDEDRSYYTGTGPHRDDWGLWTYNVPVTRVLAECAAKRRIVGKHGSYGGGSCSECYSRIGAAYPCDTLRLLALPYANHAEYDPTWAA